MSAKEIDALELAQREMLNAAFAAKMPLMIVGSPGTGKTATIRQIAEDMGYQLITLVGSQMDPTDIMGLPKGEKIGETDDGQEIFATVNLSPWWQVEVLQNKKVILFFDEWGNTPAAVQASFLTLIQDRRFPNGHKFPEETIIVGAMNPMEEGADSYEMALPTSNRFTWMSWEPPHSSWVEGMRNAWGQKVSEKEQSWKNKIASFIKENPSWLHKPPENSPTVNAYGVNPKNNSDMQVFRSAWASRRSWDNLSRILANAPDSIHVQDRLAQGTVGFSATAAFRDWLRKNDNYDPFEVMENPNSVDWTKIGLNDSNMLLRSIMDVTNSENFEKTIKVFESIADSGKMNIAAPFIEDFLPKLRDNKADKSLIEKNKSLARALVIRYREITKKSGGYPNSNS